MNCKSSFYSSLALFFVFLLYNLSAQEIVYPHPELDWKTFETEHFIFHFHQGTKRTAFVSAKIAEDIYPAITAVYNYEPPEKVHVILKDTDDYSNGAAYFFNNKMEIWATNLDYVMRGTKNWLRDVMTHEYTHMISIQKTIKSNLNLPYGFLQWFGYEKEKRSDVVRGFPNVLVSYPISSINIPVWFAEGVAQQQNDSARFDYRDPHREMVIRDRILYDRMLTYNEMTVFGKNSHGNESSYNLGFSFSKYLVDRFGEEVLSDITEVSSKWSSYTFGAVLEEATGLPVDTLYANWKDSLTQVYMKRTDNIRRNEVKGKVVEKRGFSNLHPSFSPDGKKIAYLSNQYGDYWSTDLYIRNRQTGEKEQIDSRVSSSLSWSPDGKYLAYAKTGQARYGSSFSDLYLYDLEAKESYRLTYNLRGSNPDFSNDGTRLSFVTSTNGLHQLNVYHLPQNPDADMNMKCWFNVETGILSTESVDDTNWRPVDFIGGRMEQLIAFLDGRQIYHPRWSADDSLLVFDTAVEYGRNLGSFDLRSKKFGMLLQAEEELRYPEFRRNSDWLYYAASLTGIYNLYRYNLKSRQKELLTNVPGGAFMPSVAENGDIVYALYDSVGYKIYEIDNPRAIDPALAVYDENYIESIPVKNFDDSEPAEFSVKDYKPQFLKTMILPRLFIDYETIKPGLFIVKSDVLDRLNFIGGAAVNSDFDYDLYGNFSFQHLPGWFIPALFIEVYNINANIKDELEDFDGALFKGEADINFNLLQVATGFNIILGPSMRATLSYIASLYNAKISPFVLKTDVPGREPLIQQVPLRYSYLKGHAFELRYVYNALKKDRFSEINPSAGFYLFSRFTHESNQFLTDFDITKVLDVEVYNTYVYNTFQLDGEIYFENPLIHSHALGLQFKGGYIDRPVDSFFNNFAGGIFGMRGYPFYSIEGRHKFIGSLSYRLPIHRNLDYKLGHLHFDKLYFGMFYDYGNAFNGDRIDFDRFKRDAGIELRLDSFSYNLFPTKIFFQAAWPIDKARNFDERRDEIVTYPQEWRYYFGVLFNFDLREQYNSLLGRSSSSMQRSKIW